MVGGKGDPGWVSPGSGVSPVSRVNSVSISDLPTELQAVIEAWPKMPEVIRSAIVQMMDISPVGAAPLTS